MSDITEIREKIFEETAAQRLVVKARTDQLDSHDYRVSASKFINEIFPNWENDSRIHFLAIEIRQNRALHGYRIDINNSEYDFDTAHKNVTGDRMQKNFHYLMSFDGQRDIKSKPYETTALALYVLSVHLVYVSTLR